MFVQKAIGRLEDLIAQAEALPIHTTTVSDRPRMLSRGLDGGTPARTYHQQKYRQESPELSARMVQAIRDIAPQSEYLTRACDAKTTQGVQHQAAALLADLKAGYLNDANDLAHAEVFTDLLDAAEYLLSVGQKDAAAVIAGSTLESHLRMLATKRITGFDPLNDKGKPKTGSALNAELSGAKVYDATNNKLVTAWQAIRNDAAHGNYDKYTREQVDSMIRGVLGFIANHPA